MNENALAQYKLPGIIRHTIANVITQIEPRWFVLDKGIKKYSDQGFAYKVATKNADVVIATAIDTVEHLNSTFSSVKKKVYYIQGYENWKFSDEYVKKTYSRGFKNIVISQWLKDIVDKYSNDPAVLIKNPIDIHIYRMIVSQENRKEHTIGLLYHEAPYKGLKYAFEALYVLREKYSDLEVEMFGISPRPKNIPDWIHYTKGATTEQTVEIYNKVQVFLCATVEEGYGLTGLEAMSCGTVLVSTEYQGVKEYAVNGENALLSPVKDVDALVKNVSCVFDDINMRNKLIKRGMDTAKSLNWEKAEKLFLEAMNF